MNYKEFDKRVRLLGEHYTNIETRLIYELVKVLKEVDTTLTDKEVIEQLEKLQIYNMDIGEVINSITEYPISTFKDTLGVVGNSFIDIAPLEKAYALGLVKIDPGNVRYSQVIDSHANRFFQDMDYIQKQVRQGTYRDTYRTIKKAQLNIELGYKSPNEAIVEVVQELASKGITGDTYLRQGKEVHQGMESVVRRAVRTSFTQTANDMQEHLANELGTEHWYVSQHMGARTTGTGFQNHAEWQGQVYTDEEMITELGEGEIQGFGGINCRHIKRPHIPEVSVTPPPLLNMKELERVYDLEQKQRLFERRIRATKREFNAFELIDTKESKDAQKRLKERLRTQQARLREFIKENDDVLRRDYSREKVINVE